MKVVGEPVIAKFGRKHAASRKPLARFLEIARAAQWPHFPALRQSFPAADYVSSTASVIFDIGNKYRLLAAVDFDEQLLRVERVLTHKEYNREKL